MAWHPRSIRPAPALTTLALLAGCQLVAAPAGASQIVPGDSGSAAGIGVPGTPPGGFGSCQIFPPHNYWNTPIARLPVDVHSRAWLAHLHPKRTLHAGFGGSTGIPITTVTSEQPVVPVRFRYAVQSDEYSYPLGVDTGIEGGPDATGDRRTVVVNTTTCRLFETSRTVHGASGWQAAAGATWSLESNRLRPSGWASADAAGLPILPGLLRYAEVVSGHVDHALRFSTDRTAAAHLWPARHDAGRGSGPAYPPLGARFRLRSSYHPTGMGRDARVVVRALRRYGMVLADIGPAWSLTGEQSAQWPARLIADLARIPGSAFVAVNTHPLKISGGSARARQPRR